MEVPCTATDRLRSEPVWGWGSPREQSPGALLNAQGWFRRRCASCRLRSSAAQLSPREKKRAHAQQCRGARRGLTLPPHVLGCSPASDGQQGAASESKGWGPAEPHWQPRRAARLLYGRMAPPGGWICSSQPTKRVVQSPSPVLGFATP